ncbi:hypothetical protein [Granulicella arctica]|uniref:hypothetical protein n=1 Tax=Granulicella arctica TaxID=940613 RepID=UPI0021E0A85A|nr:hypothetical protein [Granulicella arctica]
MDSTESLLRTMLSAIEAPLDDAGVLHDRSLLPGRNGLPGSAVLRTSLPAPVPR